MLGHEIRRGAYGRVYKGLDLENGDFIAIEQVSLQNSSEEDLNNIIAGYGLDGMLSGFYGPNTGIFIHFSHVLAGSSIANVFCCQCCIRRYAITSRIFVFPDGMESIIIDV
ncbi:hypothetical protein LXL04_000660 [Taraxacum kok-saghyz]